MPLQHVTSLQFWLVILLGLSHSGTRIEARAVNVSNTWTMPQEGLNVFYRFFRDRISWFEADAVCQFHHANLVTVDNSFQFDATRDLLRELDVNDIVWIGLMRPQSSERFMWSNSRPLVTDTGYWAESLPLMDAPLCAVIDPIRDYRWHALRCGGPETASFLCEMPVPSWADSCILKDMPNLTMQYMADTASIELIRNCAEEGLLKQSCKGKQDRDRALRELICPRERLEAQRINDITNSHFKSLQIINSIRTDNNENNDIELLPLGETSYGSSSSSDVSEPMPTEKNTVQRLIEQFNVDDLMQADEAPIPLSNYHIPGEIPKPVKKAAKKVVITNGGDYQKKNRSQKYDESSIQLPPPTPKPKKQQQLLALEDIMMGDQPQQSGEPEMMEHVGLEDDEVSNEIMEPLPHKKKVLPQDLRTMTPITEKSSEQHAPMVEKKLIFDTTAAPASTTASTTLGPITTTTTTPTTTTTSTTTAPITNAHSSSAAPDFASSTTAREIKIIERTVETTQAPAVTTTVHASSVASVHTTESEVLIHSSFTTAGSSVTSHAAPKTVDNEDTDSLSNIGHPMHPQQQHPNSKIDELPHPHVKELADNSHFIPPMLLVKSHYVPPLKHSEHEHHAANLNTGAAAHDVHGNMHVTTGKPIDGAVHSSSANTHTPTATTHSHTMAEKTAETDVETMTTITVTATTAAIKSAATKATAVETSTGIDGLTSEAIDKSTELVGQQQHQQGQHTPTQLTAKIIDSTSAAKTNQQQQQQQQQQTEQEQPADDKQNKLKTETRADSEVDKITKKIANVQVVAADPPTTITTNTDETTTTNTAPLTTLAATNANANANKQQTTQTPLATTTPMVSAATTTTPIMKTDDIASRHEIEKPVQRGQQTKDALVLTTNAGDDDNMPATTTTTTSTTTTTKPTTMQPDKLQTIKAVITTQKHRQEEPTRTTAATTIAETILRNSGNAENVHAVAQSILATADAAATNAPEASAYATTSAATVTPSTHTRTMTTACSSDTDLEATTADNLEASSSADEAAGKKLTRTHRTCQPRHEPTHKPKHTAKHHAAQTVEPPSPTHNFMKEETERPAYKPNRHRVLTKPETVGYFKKILG